MIQQKNVSKISNKLFEAGGKKGKRIPEAVIEKDYCLTWFLIGLSKSSLKDKLVFKGGTCLRRCYFKEKRQLMLKKGSSFFLTILLLHLLIIQ